MTLNKTVLLPVVATLLALILSGCSTVPAGTMRIRVGMSAKEAMEILNDNAEPTETGHIFGKIADDPKMIGTSSCPHWYILADRTLVMVTYGFRSETGSALLVGITTGERGVGQVGGLQPQKLNFVQALDVPPAEIDGSPGVRIWVGMSAERALPLLAACATDVTDDLKRNDCEFPEPEETEFPTPWHFLRCFKLADGRYVVAYICVDSDYRAVVGHLRLQAAGEHAKAPLKAEDFGTAESVLIPHVGRTKPWKIGYEEVTTSLRRQVLENARACLPPPGMTHDQVCSLWPESEHHNRVPWKGKGREIRHHRACDDLVDAVVELAVWYRDGRATTAHLVIPNEGESDTILDSNSISLPPEGRNAFVLECASDVLRRLSKELKARGWPDKPVRISPREDPDE